MKFSPLILFLLIISVLLISLLFSRYLPLEGFIDFNYDKTKINEIGTDTSIKIDVYSPTNPLVRLYDNLYFDCQNANIIEIDGPLITGDPASGNKVVSGTSITKTWVMQRDGSTNREAYTTETDGNNSNKIKQRAIDASKIDTIKDLKKQFIYNSQASTEGASKYQLLYIAYGQDSYIHIIDIGTTATQGRRPLKHLGTYFSTGCQASAKNTLMSDLVLGKTFTNTLDY